MEWDFVSVLACYTQVFHFNVCNVNPISMKLREPWHSAHKSLFKPSTKVLGVVPLVLGLFTYSYTEWLFIHSCIHSSFQFFIYLFVPSFLHSFLSSVFHSSIDLHSSFVSTRFQLLYIKHVDAWTETPRDDVDNKGALGKGGARIELKLLVHKFASSDIF